jgi:ATP-dependent Lhr-like helicase
MEVAYMDTFSRLHEGLRQVLAHRIGWSELRAVQEKAYEAVSGGNDVLVIAPTAGGKTEAALIPVVDGILKGGFSGVAALYLAPLKALINDQEDRFSSFCLPTGLEVLKWHGDVPKGDRAWKDNEPPHILMITPESLEVLLMERELSLGLAHLRYLIIDELHAFVESERGVQMRVLIDRLDRISGRKIQRIGLSATVGNPEEILSWLSGSRHGEVLVRIPAPPQPKRFTFVVEEKESARASALARIVRAKKALVFVNSRSDAEAVNTALAGRVDQLLVHHSSLSPEMRRETERAFSESESSCIICTSTLELGIDIGNLDVVVCIGPPPSVSSFLQRMGRSGRRGKPPYVACILKDACELLCMVAVIESASRKEVEPLHPHKKPYNVLVQQVLLEIVRKRRTSWSHIRRFVRGLFAFREIKPREIDALLGVLDDFGILVGDGDMLMPGPGAESSFGRSNWKDLFSVIKGGSEFRAVTPDGEMIGTLDARFVAGKNRKSFTLGGKSWTFVKSDDSHELVVVVPGEGEKNEIFWTGGRTGFSPVVCQAVGRILSTGGSMLPLPEPERALISGVIDALPELIPRGICILEKPGKRNYDVTILTFRGRMFNGILASLIRSESDRRLTVSYHDFSVTIKNAGKVGVSSTIYDLLMRLQERRTDSGAKGLRTPGTETWKFASALSPEILREMAFADYYRYPEFLQDFGTVEIFLTDPGGSVPAV